MEMKSENGEGTFDRILGRTALVEPLGVEHVRVFEQCGPGAHADVGVLCKQRIDALRRAVQCCVVETHLQRGREPLMNARGWRAPDSLGFKKRSGCVSRPASASLSSGCPCMQ